MAMKPRAMKNGKTKKMMRGGAAEMPPEMMRGRAAGMPMSMKDGGKAGAKKMMRGGMAKKPMGMKRGGTAKAYAKGGSVKGGGCETRSKKTRFI